MAAGPGVSFSDTTSSIGTDFPYNSPEAMKPHGKIFADRFPHFF
jgi:hypothetical protein